MNNQFLNSLKILNESDINDPVRDFLVKMNKIHYGWLDEDHKLHYGIDDTEEFFEKYVLQSPTQCWANKIGVCWDQVEVERDFFHEQDIECKSIYIAMDNEDEASHTFMLFKTDSWYWFEHSWYKWAGIYDVESVNKGIVEVVRQMKKQYPKDKVKEIYEYKRPKFGISVVEFIGHIREGKKLK